MQRNQYDCCQPVKIKVRIILISLLLGSFISCKKDNDSPVSGTVIEQKGCFADSYLVAIDNPDFSTQPFLRPTVLSACVACYNCSNAVFIRVPASFAATGTRLKFSYVNTEISCLSSSEVPAHITVKNLSRL